MASPFGNSKELSILDFNTGSGFDRRPAIGLFGADSSGATDPIWGLTGSGVASEASIRLAADALMRGIDDAQAVGSQLAPVIVRDFDVLADVDKTRRGMLTNSRLAVYDVLGAPAWSPLAGIREDDADSTINNSALLACIMRGSAYVSTARGRRFVGTPQNQTAIAIQAAFGATTPTILLNNSAATRRVILRSLQFFNTNAPTNVPQIIIAIDTANRFSAGGTSVTPQNQNAQSATASAVSGFRTGATATAAGAGTRYIFNGLMSGTPVGSNISINFEDGIMIGTTGSILIYLFNAGATQANIFYRVEWEEIT